MSGTFIELPVKIISPVGRDAKVARCGGYTASSTACEKIAMKRAAAKALNATGKLAGDVVATEADFVIVGAGLSCMARFDLDKKSGGKGR